METESIDWVSNYRLEGFLKGFKEDWGVSFLNYHDECLKEEKKEGRRQLNKLFSFPLLVELERYKGRGLRQYIDFIGELLVDGGGLKEAYEEVVLFEEEHRLENPYVPFESFVLPCPNFCGDKKWEQFTKPTLKIHAKAQFAHRVKRKFKKHLTGKNLDAAFVYFLELHVKNPRPIEDADALMSLNILATDFEYDLKPYFN